MVHSASAPRVSEASTFSARGRNCSAKTMLVTQIVARPAQPRTHHRSEEATMVRVTERPEVPPLTEQLLHLLLGIHSPMPQSASVRKKIAARNPTSFKTVNVQNPAVLPICRRPGAMKPQNPGSGGGSGTESGAIVVVAVLGLPARALAMALIEACSALWLASSTFAKACSEAWPASAKAWPEASPACAKACPEAFWACARAWLEASLAAWPASPTFSPISSPQP
mmetsp:Transcript_80964/g.169011  ORF Transcript_80964/g.169011 Transcript_80964/m.169011 type:complete len:225 (-) Transcript_80964:864-1538(-)